MRAHYRHRRGAYPLAEERTGKHWIRRIVALVVVVFVLFLLWKGMMGVLAFFGGTHTQPVALTVEQGSSVDVSYEGKDYQAAESDIKLQPGDSIRTNAASHALLHFFDGTSVRLDEHTNVSITRSTAGSKKSSIEIDLLDGTLWAKAPAVGTASGTIERLVSTPKLHFSLPGSSEVILSPRSLIVYSAAGEGVTVKSGSATASIGEGQQLILPENATTDLYSYRSAFTLETLRNTFALDSRSLASTGHKASTGSTLVTSANQLIAIASPKPNDVITGPTAHVVGKADASLQTVRINGHPISLGADGSFTTDVAVPADVTSFDLHFEGLDKTDQIVSEQSVLVSRSAQKFASPVITVPAKTGETYQTPKTQLVIRGTVSPQTASIMVNDYLLKLYNPGGTDWSYLADITLGNMKPGTNVYNVVATDAQGNKSDPATITIIQGTATAGTVSSAAGTTGNSSSVALKNNAPLLPGSLSVTAPTPGTEHTETGTGFLIEGLTSTKTASIWINDYQLQLYTPGKKTWNYIAAVKFLNLKKGTNVYHITARDKDGSVLDTMDYTVTYTPAP